MRTLSQILIDCNAFLDLEAAEPSGTELSTRSNYANQAVWEASAAAQLEEFRGVQVTPTYTLASIPLAANFKEFMTAPRVLGGDGRWTEYEEINPQDRYSRSSGDNYCYVLGNPASGYTAVFNNLTANATLSIDYQRYPTGLATLTDVCELSDPMYVVKKIESYVLQSRSDDRFPQLEADANKSLSAMIGRKYGSPKGGTNTTRKIGVAGYVLQ